MEEIIWTTKHFNDLSVHEYHDLLYLRTEVFVVEQDCPYQEVDDKDKASFHLVGKTANGNVVAVSRILPPGVSYKEVSVGRVAIKQNSRGKGIADKMMLETFEFIKHEFGEVPVRISAQEYLLNFYNKHGFKQVGEMYLEDDIPHVEMISN
jgi:ElaA protein